MSLNRVVESLLSLPRGFLDQKGDWSVQYNPAWPGQGFVGAQAWNLSLAVVALLLVVYVYTRDGRSRPLRILLGTLRGLLLALVLFLLNRPTLTLGQTRTEPSVLAILIDDSTSMRVPDVGDVQKSPSTRMNAVQKLLAGSPVLSKLAATHDVRLYKFDRDAQSIAEVKSAPVGAKSPPDTGPAVKAVNELSPAGQSTQVLPSILTVLQDLQGQHVAGVVVLTDGRDTPAHNVAAELDRLKNFGVKVFPVTVGSQSQPKNIEVQTIQVDDVAFQGDVVNVKSMVRAAGYEPGHPVKVVLKDAKTGLVVNGVDGKPSEKVISFADDKPVEVELQWQTGDELITRELVVEAVKQPGEMDDEDNTRSAPVQVLDAKVTVLFVDGSPRWDYRYLKNAMMRDKTIAVSCLLASADANFLPEGTKSLPSSSAKVAGHFPDTPKQLDEYDVIVLGDVDPRFFSDNQLQLINDFVNRGGGFAMVAGEKYSPQAYRNTPIEPLLPVSIVAPPKKRSTSQGFRPSITKSGASTSIFRFFADKQKNDDFLKTGLQELFWYCQGVVAKPSVGEVLAEHPVDKGPDGHNAPILVAGRFGGRTLFSAIDDSWRWRFYTGESVFDTYWVQQLRYLARNRKIGQRRLTLSVDQPAYELGNQIKVTLRVIDPGLLKQLPDQIRLDIRDDKDQPVRIEPLIRQEGNGGETFVASFTADKTGKFSVQLPSVVTGVDTMKEPIKVNQPRLELADPRVDRIQLTRLASETTGRTIELASAETDLAAIPSVAKTMPDISAQPIWSTWLALGLFTFLIVTEWVVRKLYGMV